MVAAYNTGRTTRHREAHSSLLDKAADFPIADAPAILERQYPSKVKSAAAIEARVWSSCWPLAVTVLVYPDHS